MMSSLRVQVLIEFLLLFAAGIDCSAFCVDKFHERYQTTLDLVQPNRQFSARWNGGYKHASSKLCDVPKKKKLQLKLSAGGVTKVLLKKRMETLQHVLTKAVLWKLFTNDYPNIEIEHDIGDPNYLPDVISLSNDEAKRPLFWGESGRMKVHKAVDLMQRYPDTHIVHCRWGIDIETFSRPLIDYLQEQYDADMLDLSGRKGKFTFCSLPLDVWRFVDEESGEIIVTTNDLEWKELDFPSKKSIEN